MTKGNVPDHLVIGNRLYQTSSHYKWKATQPKCEEKARQEQDLREQHDGKRTQNKQKKRAPIEYSARAN